MFQTLEPRIFFSAGGTGLRAVYFNNANFTGTTVTRVDRRVAFDWQHGSPDPHIAPDTFAARWTGQVQPSFSETYIFKTVSDDGVRLWVNHHLLIDTWNAQRGRATSAHRITLDASRRYEIQLEYREKT